ncbi:hypothetical protein M1P56_35975 (plasmid) [Streptomyces sp. HU2014]|uniref:hypothetical protein n=1 Tax=Streptomyces sp. HU2014 TaxID=2939414 RepID=UPI00200F96FC|nr:hypothetical protein [Streptomyces sp. HU2014]UQI49803.1 hypothetical protein M1P56_35975 [Streptomyces sp. HU2014]
MTRPPARTASVPPAWVERGTRVLIDGSVAVVTHIGNPWTSERESGVVYLRPEHGGLEFTAHGSLEPAPDHPVDERLR